MSRTLAILVLLLLGAVPAAAAPAEEPPASFDGERLARLLDRAAQEVPASVARVGEELDRVGRLLPESWGLLQDVSAAAAREEWPAPRGLEILEELEPLPRGSAARFMEQPDPAAEDLLRALSAPGWPELVEDLLELIEPR